MTKQERLVAASQIRLVRGQIASHKKKLKDFPFYDEDDYNKILVEQMSREIKLYRLLYAIRKGKLH